MNSVRQLLFAVLLELLLWSGPAMAKGEFVYTIAAGETLSEIAYDKLDGSVYHRKRGNLLKIYALNPWLKDPKQLRPGMRIVLPASLLTKQILDEGRTPAATAIPTQEKIPEYACKQDDDDEEGGEPDPVSRLGASLGLEYFRIDGRDKASGALAEILSDMSPSLHLNWALDWNRLWTTILSFDYRSDRIAPIGNAAKTISGSGKSFGFSAQVERHWNDDSYSSVKIGKADQLFVRATSSQALSLDRVGIATVGIKHEQRLVKVKSASAGVGGAVDYLFSGHSPGYKVDAGLAGRGFAFIEHRRQSFSLRGEVFLEKKSQNSSITEQKTTTTGMAIGLGWSLP